MSWITSDSTRSTWTLFPGPGPRYQISTDGGGSPIWRGDGRELFYLASASGGSPRQSVNDARGGSDATFRVMAVTVSAQTTLTFGAPRQLFVGQYRINGPARGYDVSRDGQRFLLPTMSSMFCILSWSRAAPPRS